MATRPPFSRPRDKKRPPGLTWWTNWSKQRPATNEDAAGGEVDEEIAGGLIAAPADVGDFAVFFALSPAGEAAAQLRKDDRKYLISRGMRKRVEGSKVEEASGGPFNKVQPTTSGVSPRAVSQPPASPRWG